MANKRIVIVGGGAAGLMAAIWAAGEPHEVLILERMPSPGRKILIAGGGRCNVLPSQVRANQYHTESSQSLFKKIFQSWSLPGQQRFFEETLGIPLKIEEETGKVFPTSDRAADVLQGLLNEAMRRGARLRVKSSVEGIIRDGACWRVSLAEGETLEADALIIATGGLSVPKTGSDGTGIRLVRALGHTTHTLYPALTPLLTTYRPHHDLAGISLNVTLFAPQGNSIKKGERAEGGFLFTHRGYSGPTVLDLSHHAVRARGSAAQPLLVQWLPMDAEAWEALFLKSAPTTHIRTLVRAQLPTRLADMLLEESGAMERTVAELRREERLRLVECLTRYPLPYSGDEGYKKAEITGGGVPLGEINPVTMESRLHPGLFLCGEILDLFGPIGGYNFLWAWATGRLAGQGARHISEV
ncbi:MAG: aminoacetone oxidase family FAD-binding enzyme [Ardenticatenales bacterium]|nr:aminoacetone oxidase family FAD-binding enzyme [Ardenticatenales bacterium]